MAAGTTRGRRADALLSKGRQDASRYRLTRDQAAEVRLIRREMRLYRTRVIHEEDTAELCKSFGL
jgi:hypothetical protein